MPPLGFHSTDFMASKVYCCNLPSNKDHSCSSGSVSCSTYEHKICSIWNWDVMQWALIKKSIQFSLCNKIGSFDKKEQAEKKFKNGIYCTYNCFLPDLQNLSNFTSLGTFFKQFNHNCSPKPTNLFRSPVFAHSSHIIPVISSKCSANFCGSSNIFYKRKSTLKCTVYKLILKYENGSIPAQWPNDHINPSQANARFLLSTFRSYISRLPTIHSIGFFAVFVNFSNRNKSCEN